jgi:hypothetical protein
LTSAVFFNACKEGDIGIGLKQTASSLELLKIKASIKKAGNLRELRIYYLPKVLSSGVKQK